MDAICWAYQAAALRMAIVGWSATRLDREPYNTSIIEIIWRLVTYSEDSGIPWYSKRSVTTKPRGDSLPILIIEYKNSLVVRS